MRMKLIAPMAALVLAAAGGSAAGAATTITSTFDTGTEGWTFGTYNGVTGQPVTWEGATQTLAKINHGFGAGVFLAPAAYLGDKSEYEGGTFSFDLSTTFVDLSYQTRPALVLIGKNNQFLFSRSTGFPATTLTHFDIGLSAANFYKGSPTGAVSGVGAAEFASILGDLRGVGIWADWTANVETDRLDNVAMAGQAAVPEPAAWALMILGFGAVGSTLRRRRAGYAAA